MRTSLEGEILLRVPTVTTPPLPAPLSADAPYRVSVVCTGNICRSAMAEMVLIDRLASEGVPATGAGGVVVTSSGVSDEEHGNPVDRRALTVLADAGYGQGSDAASRAVATAVDTHRAHRVSDEEIRGSDLVLAMTSRHWRELRRRAGLLGVDLGRVRMFRELDPALPGERRVVSDDAGPHRDLDVPDPWYGTVKDFEDTLEVVERVVGALVPHLGALASSRAPA